MLAYHNNPQIKSDILDQLQAHMDADELAKGQYWENGKGCAAACTIHGSDHMEYETRFGIPVMLARLEDRLFEGMPNEDAMLWPMRFMSAIQPGMDLSLVGWKFQYWLLTDPSVNPGITHETVRDAVKLCADVIYPLTEGLTIDPSAALSAEKSAARIAEESAEWSAAALAALAAESAARAARIAEWGAMSAVSAEWSAEWSARSAARSAEWSAANAESAAYLRMSEKLLELIAECETQ